MAVENPNNSLAGFTIEGYESYFEHHTGTNLLEDNDFSTELIGANSANLQSEPLEEISIGRNNDRDLI